MSFRVKKLSGNSDSMVKVVFTFKKRHGAEILGFYHQNLTRFDAFDWQILLKKILLNARGGFHFQKYALSQNVGSLRPKLAILTNLMHFEAFDRQIVLKIFLHNTRGGFHFQK